MNIVDIEEAKGSGHDFKVFKDAIGSSVSASIPIGGQRVSGIAGTAFELPDTGKGKQETSVDQKGKGL
jgi:hypothetical protein